MNKNLDITTYTPEALAVELNRRLELAGAAYRYRWNEESRVFEICPNLRVVHHEVTS